MASERKPVDSISIRQMGAIEVQSVQFGLMAAFVPPGSLVASRALEVISIIVLIIRRKLHIAEMKSYVSSFCTMFRQIESDNYLFIRLFTIFIQLAQVSFKVGLNGSL